MESSSVTFYGHRRAQSSYTRDNPVQTIFSSPSSAQTLKLLSQQTIVLHLQKEVAFVNLEAIPVGTQQFLRLVECTVINESLNSNCYPVAIPKVASLFRA